MKKLLSVLLATCALTLGASQLTSAQEGSLSADQLTVFNTLPADQQAAIGQLSAEQQAELLAAIIAVQAAVLGGDATVLPAAMARLSAAIATLPPAARGDVAVAVAVNVQAIVNTLPPDSPIRTVAAAAVLGVGQIATANGASTAQLATIQQVAVATQGTAPAPTPNIGTVEPNPQGSPTNP